MPIEISGEDVNPPSASSKGEILEKGEQTDEVEDVWELYGDKHHMEKFHDG